MITVRPLVEADLAEADAIFRLAFGTFIGLPDPTQFMAGRDYAYTRFRTNPAGAMAVELDGRFISSTTYLNWGSFGTLGPSRWPEHWNGGVARA